MGNSLEAWHAQRGQVSLDMQVAVGSQRPVLAWLCPLKVKDDAVTFLEKQIMLLELPCSVVQILDMQ